MMKWTVRLFVCAVVFSTYLKCEATKMEEFLQEEHDFLQEVDRLFYTYYYNKASQLQHADEPYMNLNQNEQPAMSHNGPMPSPDWSPDLSNSGDFFEDVDSDEKSLLLDDFSTEVDNYRPRVDPTADHTHSEERRIEGDNEYDGSGDDAGTDLNTTPGDDEESYLHSGSGDSGIIDKTTSPHFVSSTSIPVEETTSVYLQCGDHLKSEIITCIKMSLSLKTLLYEMGLNFVQTGYYNVSSNNDYLFHLFRTCISSIDTPPKCVASNGDDSILDVVSHRLIAFANEKDNEQVDEVVVEESSVSCFSTHLYSLRSCLTLRLDTTKLENLVKIVIQRPEEVMVEDCQAFQEVRGCMVWSMRRCDDSTSVVLVEDMFEATMRGIETCSRQYVSDATWMTSLGALLTLTISILVARF